VVQWFLAHGASPKLGPPGSVLNATASIGTPATFQLLLRQGASLSRGDAFRSAAGSPEDAGRIPMLTYLIDVLGLEVDPPDENVNGQIGTPIHSAIRSGGLEKVKFLVWKGANLQRRNRMGFTPLEVAEKTLFMQIRAFLSNASRTANGRKS